MRLINFSIVFFLSLSIFADPGGWIISGGEIFKNGKNPWFVKSTTEIQYCIQFSQDEFSIQASEIPNLIQQGLAYWKEQLNGESSISLDLPDKPLQEEKVQLANQKFIFHSSCHGSEDLVFKFGYKTLDIEEKNKMGSPEKYLGLTIRKKYDDSILKGQGIIYVSGDLGVNAYKKTSKETIDQAWKYPKLLQYVLIHELGHVFGLPHSGSGLMSEVFLDQLIIRKFAAMYVREPILPLVKPPASAEICDSSFLPKGSQSFLASYFSLVYKEDCLKLELTENKKEFSISTKKIQDLSWKKIGTLVIDKNEVIDFSLKPSVILQLNEEQSVFKNVNSSFLMGPIFQNYKVDGHINFGTSLKPYTVQVELSPDSIVVYGLHENKIRQIFSFGNPLLFSLKNPF